jgi:hypothetical protein
MKLPVLIIILASAAETAGEGTAATSAPLRIESPTAAVTSTAPESELGHDFDDLLLTDEFAVVPLPSALALGVTGLAGLIVWNWCRRRSSIGR